MVATSIDKIKRLVELSWLPITMKSFPFGKHQGVLLKDIPTDYFLWGLKNLVYSINQEVERRFAERNLKNAG